MRASGCLYPCVQTRYAPSVSQNSMQNPSAVIADYYTDHSLVNDVTVVTVQARSLNLFEIDQTEANALADALGGVGGNMVRGWLRRFFSPDPSQGMWAGMSVISIIDFLEALCMIIITSCVIDNCALQCCSRAYLAPWRRRRDLAVTGRRDVAQRDHGTNGRRRNADDAIALDEFNLDT